MSKGKNNNKTTNSSSSSPFVQYWMGTVFTGMGLATMLFPKEAIQYSFTKEFLQLPEGIKDYPKSLILTMQCFGSQASLCGLLILSSKFTKKTFRNFGLAMIPYFIFDYYFWKNNALTSFGAIGDGVGNMIFSLCCYLGYQQLQDAEEEEGHEDQ